MRLAILLLLLCPFLAPAQPRIRVIVRPQSKDSVSDIAKSQSKEGPQEKVVPPRLPIRKKAVELEVDPAPPLEIIEPTEEPQAQQYQPQTQQKCDGRVRQIIRRLRRR